MWVLGLKQGLGFRFQGLGCSAPEALMPKVEIRLYATDLQPRTSFHVGFLLKMAA